jgi:hypothetical protein
MKINWNKKNRHYLEYLPTLFVVALFFEFLPVEFTTSLYVYIGFCWPLAITAPYLSDVVGVKKYRFSFIKLIYQFNNFLMNLFPEEKRHWSDLLTRAMSPLIFCALMGVVAGDWFFFLSLLGSAIFELNRYFILKYHLNKSTNEN